MNITVLLLNNHYIKVQNYIHLKGDPILMRGVSPYWMVVVCSPIVRSLCHPMTHLMRIEWQMMMSCVRTL